MEADPDDDLQRLGLEFYERERVPILKLCRKLTRRLGPQRAQLLEDALHEAMRTVPMAMATWRADGGACLRTHVLGDVRWYVWKMLKRRARAAGEQAGQTGRELEEIACDDKRAAVELQARDEVEYLLDGVPDAQAEVLKWRYCEGLGLDVIAELLGCSKSSAYRYVNDALEAARAEAARLR